MICRFSLSELLRLGYTGTVSRCTLVRFPAQFSLGLPQLTIVMLIVDSVYTFALVRSSFSDTRGLVGSVHASTFWPSASFELRMSRIFAADERRFFLSVDECFLFLSLRRRNHLVSDVDACVSASLFPCKMRKVLFFSSPFHSQKVFPLPANCLPWTASSDALFLVEEPCSSRA